MKATTNRQKKGVFRLFLLLMMTALLVTGCEQNPSPPPEEQGEHLSAGLEVGFDASSQGEESLPVSCAYRSDKTEFDIDDVTLDFYYGHPIYSSPEYLWENVMNVPSFDVCFSNGAGLQIHVKHVEENLVSEKYRCELIYDENWNFIEKKFNYSESITIPKELFTEKSGVIIFKIRGANVRESEEIIPLGSAYINYEVFGDKVVLTSNKAF